MAAAEEKVPFFQRFAVLKGAPRELWIVYGLKFLESYAYFSMSYVLVMYLSKEFGFTDVEAGWAYGLFGMLISVYGLLIGFVIDNLGVRKSMILGSVILLASRFILTVTTNTYVMSAMLYSALPLGTALGIPVMMTGIRRYTNDSNRSFGFSLFYVMMNVAALVAAPAVDGFREGFREGIDTNFFGMWSMVHLTPYRLLLLSGTIATLLMLIVSVFFIREIDVSQEGAAQKFKPKTGTPWQIMWEIASTSRFWRFLLFIVLLIGVRFIFRHMDATFPKYMERTFGFDAPWGTIIGINPFLIIFIVPIVTALTAKVPAFKMIVWGTIVSGLSVFFLCIGSIPILDSITPYWAAIGFVVLLSIGEAFWSPRLYEYTAMIAPKGREGSYMALSAAPMFIAKLMVGGVSGYMLNGYCPQTPDCKGTVLENHCLGEMVNGECTGEVVRWMCDGEVAHHVCQGEIMWYIIGLMTISSPILILLLKKVIQGGEGVEVLSDHDEDSPDDPQDKDAEPA